MATIIRGEFEWDEAKAEANEGKHGVSFVEAATVLAGPNFILVDDGSAAGIEKAIGFSLQGRVLTVVHIERGERTRIISAWRATAAEAALFEEG